MCADFIAVGLLILFSFLFFFNFYLNIVLFVLYVSQV